jgi:hypothetical protein
MKNERFLLRDVHCEYALTFDAPSFKMAALLHEKVTRGCLPERTMLRG